MKNNFDKFYDVAIKDLKDHNIKLKLQNRKKIKLDDGYCSGYFDGKTLVVALKTSLAQETFVHEYCHFLQYKEQSPLWEVDGDIFDRLLYKDFGIKDWDILMETIALERDCESRAIKISEEYNLFDNEKYAQSANAYLYFYHYVFLKGKWFDSNTIYQKGILEKMPTKILPLSKFKKIDMELMKVYENVLNGN